MSAFQENRIDALRQYIGSHYSNNGATDKVPINLILIEFCYSDLTEIKSSSISNKRLASIEGWNLPTVQLPLDTLPGGGTYYVHLADSQNHGGQAYGYRLRIRAPQPDFALCTVPSSLSVRAGPAVPVSIYALRKDGNRPNQKQRNSLGVIPAIPIQIVQQ